MGHMCILNQILSYLAVCSLSSITILTGLVLIGSTVSADDVVDNVSITVPISCSMTGTISSGNEHTAEIANGTYQANIGTTSIKTLCNDNAGFSIYAIGYSGEQLGTEDSTKLLGTSASNNAKIVTGTATTAGNPDVSNWAMKLATDSQATYPLTILSDENESSFASYHTVPTEYTKVATRLSGTDTGSNATGSTLTTTYAAYISKTQAADTYTGKVKYVLVHPNDGAVPEMPITPPISCTTPVPNLTYMQDLTSANKASVLASMTEDAQYYLADKRDDKTYCVAKLKDGNIWMTQNLDHDIKADGSVIYNSTTTDIGWNGSGYDTASWAPIASATTIAAADATGWYNDYYAPQSFDPGDYYWSGAIIPASELTTYENTCDWDNSMYPGRYINCDETINPYYDAISSTGNSHYHLGNYYNWTAAVIMNDGSDFYTGNTIKDQSICPVGWTMPHTPLDDIDDVDYLKLLNLYGFTNRSVMGDNNVWSSPIYFAATGSYSGSLTPSGVGINGSISSSALYYDGDEYKYHVSFGTSGGSYSLGDGGNDRSAGNPVRCVAR